MSVSISLLHPILEVAARAGVERACVTERARFDSACLGDASARISEEAYARVVEAALELSSDPLLGLHAGALSSTQFSLVGYLASSASSVRQALDALFRYQPLLGDRSASRLEEGAETATIVLDFVRASPVCDRVTAEAAVARLLTVSELFFARDSVQVQVCFEHAVPRSQQPVVAGLLAAQVAFERSHTSIIFPRALLDLTRAQVDVSLFRALERESEQRLQALYRAELPRAVERLIMRGVLDATPGLTDVARALGLTSSALRHRLAREGSSFRDLLDQVRRELALAALHEPDVSVKEIAYNLGFSEPSAFHRAFRRWTGTTPAQFRVAPGQSVRR